MKNDVPVYGLVLTGGESRRMRRDKAVLDYHGKPQLEWMVELLAPYCERVFVSVRRDQQDESVRARFPQIVDRAGEHGPAAGIGAAWDEFPEVAWLVAACDLPFVDTLTIEHLLGQRDPSKDATAFVSSRDGLPEPLCAIWEPRLTDRLKRTIAGGQNCPRRLLIDSDTKLIEQPDPRSLDNINTPDDLREVSM
ncbi:MAG: NTP transferase domain-containing protein [Gammaproteobacteria bacterium]